MSLASSWFACIGYLAIGSGLVIGCRTPTQVTIEVSTDVPCSDQPETTIATGKPSDVEMKPAAAFSAACSPTGRIASLVVVPVDDKSDELAFKVVTARGGKSVEQCVAPQYGPGCIVARRSLRFIPHEELSVPVVMRQDCDGVPCLANETCVRHACVPSQIPDPRSCIGGGCPEAVLRPSSGSDGGNSEGGEDAGGADDTGVDDAMNDRVVSAPDVSTTDAPSADGSPVEDAKGDGSAPIADANSDGPSTQDSGAQDTASARDATPPGDAGTSCGVIAVAPGGYHICAVRADGTLFCWGTNNIGELGDGTLQDKLTPVPVNTLGPNVTQVAATESHTCAITRDNALYCWGSNMGGELGDGTIESGFPYGNPIPQLITALGNQVAQVATGSGHTCAITFDGSLYCWGSNTWGQLGNGSVSLQPVPNPTKVTALGTDVAQVTGGDAHTCVRKKDGTAWCWGYNMYGQLGLRNTTTPQPTISQVTTLGSNVASIGAGRYHTCARTTLNAAFCWGDNRSGIVGDGTAGGVRSTPVQVPMLANLVVQLSAHAGETNCAKTNTSALFCWGSNYAGAIGDGTMATDAPFYQASPKQVTDLGMDVAEVQAGNSRMCAITMSHELYCWGAIALNDTNNKPSPVRIPIPCP